MSGLVATLILVPGVGPVPPSRAAHLPAVRPRPREHASNYLVHFDNGWRAPSAVEDRGGTLPRPIHPKHRDEFPLGGGQPVGFLIAARRLVLEMKSKRAVLVVL
jgi:hypothetical protein